MPFTSNYRKLATYPPVVEQVAAWRKKRGQRLSNAEKAELRARKRARRQVFIQALKKGTLALPQEHPARKPGAVKSYKPGTKYGDDP